MITRLLPNVGAGVGLALGVSNLADAVDVEEMKEVSISSPKLSSCSSYSSSCSTGVGVNLVVLAFTVSTFLITAYS